MALRKRSENRIIKRRRIPKNTTLEKIKKAIFNDYKPKRMSKEYAPQELPTVLTIPYVMGKISNVVVRTLLDTGAECNVMSYRAFKQLKRGAFKMVYQKEIEFLITPKSDVIPVKQKILCETILHGRQLGPLIFYIADISEDAIIGSPAIYEYNLYPIMKQVLEPFMESVVHDDTRMSSDFQGPTSNVSQVSQLILEEEANEILDEEKPQFKITEDLELRVGIEKLMTRYETVFSSLPLNGATVEPMEIETICTPVPCRPRRVSPTIEAAMRVEIQNLLDQNIIRPSSSSFSSPVVMVRKKSGEWRFCVDYRLLNKCTKRLQYPLPNNNEIIERLSGKKYFCVLDLKSGFWQFPIKPNDIPKTAFSVPWGLYEFTRSSMGLTNAPAYFQQTMNNVLSDLIGIHCDVFIDDIIIYGETKEELLKSLQSVLERLQAFDIRVNMSKCQMGLEEVEYVGHIVGRNGVKVSPRRVQALQALPVPKNLKDLRHFMGIANYMRRFINNFARVCKPLSAMMSDKVPFHFGQEQKESFEAIKEALVNAPVLRSVDYTKDLYLRTDASKQGVGAYIFQYDKDGSELPVVYVSKAFDTTQANWSTSEQEAFAIVFAVTKLRHYLLGYPFIIQSDHRNLQWLLSSQVPKLIRWGLILSEFQFNITHIPGKENIVADTLSRILASIRIKKNDFTADEFQEVDLEDFHNGVVGHGGVTKTLKLLHQQGFDVTGLAPQVYSFIRQCAVCEKTRGNKSSNVEGAHHYIGSWEPFDTIHIDTIGPLRPDSLGNKYIICMVDGFTRFVEVFPCKDVTALTASKMLLQVFGRYGKPRAIRADGGTQFTADIIQEFLKLLDIEKITTIPYHPSSNGIVERANGEVVRHLRALVFDKRLENWSEVLPIAQRIINDSFHSAIGTCPSNLLYAGQIPPFRGLFDATQNNTETAGTINNDYLSMLRDRSLLLHQRSLEYLAKVHKEQKHEALAHDYKIGDFVYFNNNPSRMGHMPLHKLAARWCGPRKIIDIKGSVFTLEDISNSHASKFDISRLKKYFGSTDKNVIIDLIAKDKNEWSVESIVDHDVYNSSAKNLKDRYRFRIRWTGFGPDEDEWFTFTQANELEALDRYLLEHPELPKMLRRH